MLDQTDKKLINLLQENSKQTNKQLAFSLNLSVTAVYERIKKLEKSGVIKKHVALIDKNIIQKSLVVFCHIRLTLHSKENIQRFEKEIVELSEVSECFHVSGDYDYIIKIYMKDMDEYREFMVKKLTAISNIASTHSTFTIKEVKNRTEIFV